MMTTKTKRALDIAVDELKRNGYSVLMLMFDTKADESQPMGSAIEILSSETNDPQVLAAMAKHALTEMSRPLHLPETIN
jgi:hypothetical protein